MKGATSSRNISFATCSYEGSLFGFDVDRDGGEDSLRTSMIFGFSITQGSLRAIAASARGKYLACGGVDEIIRIFDAKQRKSIGELRNHEGAITSLTFFEDSYLLSGSEDHSVCIWRTSDWVCIHKMEAHTASVNSVGIHPSGKLAISVSKDKSMRLWNLMLGESARVTCNAYVFDFFR